MTVDNNPTIARKYIDCSITDLNMYNFAKKPANGGIPANEKSIINKDKDSIGEKSSGQVFQFYIEANLSG